MGSVSLCYRPAPQIVAPFPRKQSSPLVAADRDQVEVRHGGAGGSRRAGPPMANDAAADRAILHEQEMWLHRRTEEGKGQGASSSAWCCSTGGQEAPKPKSSGVPRLDIRHYGVTFSIT